MREIYLAGVICPVVDWRGCKRQIWQVVWQTHFAGRKAGFTPDLALMDLLDR
jgi:hypothetical protein